MATYQVSPPEPFTFSRLEEWPKWIKRFERFCLASDLNKKNGVSQVNTLIYTMGSEADDILYSFQLSETDSKKYEVVKGKFDSHFIKRRNVIFERAKLTEGDKKRVSQWTHLSLISTAYQNTVTTHRYGMSW